MSEEGLENMTHRDWCYLKTKLMKEKHGSRSRMEDCSGKQRLGTSEGSVLGVEEGGRALPRPSITSSITSIT